MAMRLALAVGEPNVDRLFERITARQFVEWCAFYRIDPWGSQRQDLNFADLMSFIGTILGDKSCRPGKFMRFSDKPKNGTGFSSFVRLMSGSDGGQKKTSNGHIQ